MLVVSGGYLPGSLRGSEKLFNNQWHQITWMHTWVSMHLRSQKLKSWKKYMFYQAPLNVFRQEKTRRKISLFSRDSDHSSWTPLWVFILVWRPDAYSCTHFLFHSDYYFFQNGPYFYSERFRKRNLEIKHVSIQSTWGRLGSLINVKLASWQKCKQAYEVSAMQSQTVNSYIFEPTMIPIMRNGLKRL